MLTRGRRRPSHPKPQPPSLRGEVAGFRSERWPLSNRNRGRLQIGTVAGIKSEKVAAFSWNLQAAPAATGLSHALPTPNPELTNRPGC
jgi:hypothetical protein